MKKLLTLCLSLLLALSFPASASRTLPYTIDLTAGTSVHAGPGKEYERALTLDEDGVFTIVEETLGADDEFWGKLKSGAGWVQITFRVDEPSRTVSLSAGTAVRSGPGSQYDLAQTIDEDGVFTIVEESYDSNINLWGRLKSGAGWVQLSGVLPRTVSLPAGTTVHAAPDISSDRAQTIDEDGVFTIVEDTRDASGNLWGKLQSGAGWVALNISSYIIPLYAGTEIHEGPGYDFAIANAIDEKGMFTIVEEIRDQDYNLWGRLKSGAGWVFLQSEQTLSVAPMRAHYAEDVSLQSEPIHIIADTSEYAVDIVFIPNEDIRDIVFSSLQPTDIDYEVAELLFSAEELSAYTPLLASVAFPGDMSAYGLAFTDAGGNFRRYTVSISGRDGMLELTEQY